MSSENIKKRLNVNFAIIITQCAFCLTLLAVILSVKFLGGNLGNEFSDWYNVYVKDQTDIKEVLNNSALTNSDLIITPLNGEITSKFGYRSDPITGEIKMHNGLDIAADEGSSIVSAGAGTVIHIGYSNSYGNYIVIDHQNGINTLYGHCNSLIASEGDSVCCGQPIATVGSTGRSTGNHLHFEIIKNSVKINPLWVID